MSKLLRGGLACPHCGSSDAVAEYETNFYCFSCHVSRIKVRTVTKSLTVRDPLAKTVADLMSLPDDVTLELPTEARVWLYKYHFNDALIESASIMWSPSFQRVIIPGYVDGILEFFDARSLKKGETKYLSYGSKKAPYLRGWDKVTPIVIVEDMLSAIRVGAQFRTLSLRGTHTTLELLSKAVGGLDPSLKFQFVVWLDGDTPGIVAAEKLLPKLQWFGKSASITTSRDPKCYSDSEIYHKLKMFL